MQTGLLWHRVSEGLKGYHLLFISIIIFHIFIFVLLMPYYETHGYSINNSSQKSSNDSTKPRQLKQFGVWASHQLPIEKITNPLEMKNAIHRLLKQGYSEYYFPIVNYESEGVDQKVEDLLTITDNTALKMFAILFPPSEAVKTGNYDWRSG